MTPDPFGTGQVRERVLASWTAAAVRFREDANAEEDLALGGYRDRLVVELAQNAADAAARAGVPGRLHLALRDLPLGEVDTHPVLVASNTGAHLDADGIQALATLRASAKRDDLTVGRFGVGFAAVLAVSDEPAVVSRSGGVRFSAGDTRALVEQAAVAAPDLAAELARRDGHVPVLRLPFPAEGTPADGYDTAVLLPLRDAAARDLVDRLLDEVDDTLLLALPVLAEVVVERPDRCARVLADVESRWYRHRTQGLLAPALVADRPTEERARPGWQVTWAVPRRPGAAGLGFVHAPTPTDEPLDWPALLVATFPLDPTRRHVATGPATDELVRQAAAGYAEFLAELAQSPSVDGLPAVTTLVPTGLPRGALDAALREATLARLPGVPLLRSAEDADVVLRPRDAVALDPPAGSDPAAVAALARVVSGLVAAPRDASPALDLLGVRRLQLDDIVDQLPDLGDPARWRDLYGALETLADDAVSREALAGLPVPLADGRLVRGVRGLVLPIDAPGVAGALAHLGIRAVHPDAAHPLLERLGAVRASPVALLERPEVRAAAAESPDAEDPAAVADAVLTLVEAAVAAGGLRAGAPVWLGELALPDVVGDLAPASALALSGSTAAAVFDPDEIGLVHPGLEARWGGPVLEAVGVLRAPAVLVAHDVALAEGGGDVDDDVASLPGWDGWVREVLDRVEDAGGRSSDAVAGEVTAVRDLDAVAPERWPAFLAAMAGEPVPRRALTALVRVRAGGVAVDVPGPTAWWLRRVVAPDGAARGPDADRVLAALLPAAPGWVAGLDPQVRGALGVLTGLDGLDRAALPAVLRRLAAPEVSVAAVDLVDLWRRLAVLASSRGGTDVPAPEHIRVISGNGSRVVPASSAVVAEAPYYRQRGDLPDQVLCAPGLAEALAELLDLPLAGEAVAGDVDEEGSRAGQTCDVPAAATTLVPGCPVTWCEHDVLVVDGIEVDWWVDGADGDDPAGRGGTVHACTLEGLARGLAWAGGAWGRRLALAEALQDAEAVTDLRLDEAFTG